MLSYLEYLEFLHAVCCREQLSWFPRIISSMFLRKKKLKITWPFCMGYGFTKMDDFKVLSHLDYLVFLHAVFCTELLYWFRKIIFSMFLPKKS